MSLFGQRAKYTKETDEELAAYQLFYRKCSREKLYGVVILLNIVSSPFPFSLASLSSSYALLLGSLYYNW